MSVYTTVFCASVPIGGLAMGAIASGFGVALAIAIGGVLSLLVGLGALAWGRTRRVRRGRPAAAVRERDADRDARRAGADPVRPPTAVLAVDGAEAPAPR